MPLSADRVTGGFFLFFGLALYFVVIPTYVETIEDSSWVRPGTIPNAIAVVLSVCGALLILKPTAHRVQGQREFLFAGLYFLLLAAGLLLMSYVGFVYAAPVIALVIMLMIGERRRLWLGVGVVALPAAIWLLVVQVLERALP
ncbi:hypothetical protein GG681_15020 [Epibacterium sp. SM1969]|uniref:DUF1468 domain-containing protein n=1 Tax=Tritonibacter aquimaris TaxID=2663379 RepID=A0A844AVQ8_9RHOB|nr:tripartite tricarboxylate transporter TctB family protein [Tritonibacter aquimaris]MQY43957.1 hypothetical protein [Tritonibacter aquimaris]